MFIPESYVLKVLPEALRFIKICGRVRSTWLVQRIRTIILYKLAVHPACAGVYQKLLGRWQELFLTPFN
jgi:hypothetical protein